MGSEIITNEDGIYFNVEGIQFRQLTPDSQFRKTTDSEVLILKSPALLRQYDNVFTKLPTPNVLEFGFAEGGSLLYFAKAFPEFRYVGIDLREPNEAFLRHIDRAGLADRVKVYYNTSQDNGVRINEIIRENFGDEPLGCVIDDASRRYTPSRHTFEITFHQLAEGGKYCLEGWSWAHESGGFQIDQWLDQPALTNLLFEITMLLPSARGFIDSIEINSNLMMVHRGSRPGAGVKFDNSIINRGRKLTLI